MTVKLSPQQTEALMAITRSESWADGQPIVRVLRWERGRANTLNGVWVGWRSVKPLVNLGLLTEHPPPYSVVLTDAGRVMGLRLLGWDNEQVRAYIAAHEHIEAVR